MADKPQLLPLRDGWILRAGRDYSPGNGVVRGALVLTKAELDELRSLLREAS